MKQPYKIYRDPIPEVKGRRSSPIPFGQMEVGGRFAAPKTPLNTANEIAVFARNWTARNRNDWRFLVRIVDGAVAVWRVK